METSAGRRRTIYFAIVAAVAATSVGTGSARAQTILRTELHLPRQTVADSVRQLALAARTTILVDAGLGLREARPIDGTFTVEQALAGLLSQSGLSFERIDGGYVVRAIKTEDPPAGGEIVVVGSRIRGAGAGGAEVTIIKREDIDRSGYGTTQQVLQTLPQNFGGGPNDTSVGISQRNGAPGNLGQGSSINLRGLGPASTLILIDGNRIPLGGAYGAFSDLSLIPSSAIDRIEVLGDGASALYGSDAVAGVVNLRLRNGFDGFETRARVGVADGFTEAQASQLVGLHWSGGHAVLGYEYFQQDNLAATDRRYATEDLTPFGGPDYRKSFSNPGTLIAADGQTFAIPHGQDGRNLAAGNLVPGTSNLFDGRSVSDLLPRQQRHALYAIVTQDLTDRIRLFAQGFAADRYTQRRNVPEDAQGISVPSSNPYYVDPIGTGEPVTVNYVFTDDFGPQLGISRVRAYSGVAGLDFDAGDWSAAVRGSFGLQIEKFRQQGVPNYPALATALADSDPATAFNPFGDGSFTNSATIDKVRGYIDNDGNYRIWTGSFKVDGPIADLPAGNVKIAFGGEYRRENYDASILDYEFSDTPTHFPVGGLPISRSVTAAFAELLIPVTAPDNHITGVRRLDLSLAGRIEHYSDFGSTANPKLGVHWEVTSGLAVRGTIGTSFRAPSFQDVRQGPGTGIFIPLSLPDPLSATGSSNALVLFGNKPGIGPERATTWTAGVDLAPPALPGLRVNATYFDIRYRDRIANISTDFTTFLTDRARYAPVIDDNPSANLIASLYQDPIFSNPYGIAQRAIDVVIDGRVANLSNLHEAGVDFDVGYQVKREKLAADVGISGTYLFSAEQRLTKTAAGADVISTIGNPVDLRLRGRFAFSAGRLNASAFVNFIDGYRNTAVLPPERVHSWTTVDLSAGYDFGVLHGPLVGTRIAISATNLLDRDPPYVNNVTPYSAIGYDGDNASPAGRVIAMQVIKTW